MNKKEQTSVEGVNQPSKNITTMVPTRDYFTREVEEIIRDMSEDEMMRELLNFEQSRSWIAMLRYNQIRLSQSQSAILSADPVKDPTHIARNQGIMLGLCDLQNAIIILKQQVADGKEGKED